MLLKLDSLLKSDAQFLMAVSVGMQVESAPYNQYFVINSDFSVFTL